MANWRRGIFNVIGGTDQATDWLRAVRSPEEIANIVQAGRGGRLTQPQMETLIGGLTEMSRPASEIPTGAMSQIEGLPYALQPTKGHIDPMEYGTSAMSLPPEAYAPTVTRSNTPNLPRQTLNPEYLLDKNIMPMPWDRMGGGYGITGVGNMTLQRLYNAMGGLDFTRGAAHQADNAVSASSDQVARRIANQAKNISDATGKDTLAVVTTMPPSGLDYSKNVSRIGADLIQQQADPRQLAGFENTLRAATEGRKLNFQDMPPMMSPEFDDWLMNTSSGDQRKALIDAYGKYANRKDVSLPRDAFGAARYAVTDPSQLYTPSMHGGLGVIRIDPNMPLIDNPAVPHDTYWRQLRGEYLGGLEVPLPTDIMWRDAYAKYFSPDYVSTNGTVGAMTPSNAYYALKTQLPAQYVDEELLRSWENYVANPRGGILGLF